MTRKAKRRRTPRPTLKQMRALTYQSEDLARRLQTSERVRGDMGRIVEQATADVQMFEKEGAAEIRVLRIIEYRGPQRWVEETVQTAIHGTKYIDDGKSITAVTLHEYPEILEIARRRAQETQQMTWSATAPVTEPTERPAGPYAKGDRFKIGKSHA